MLMVNALAGCLSGDTIINVNRAKKGSKMTLEKLVKQFNGKKVYYQRSDNNALASMRPWNLNIDTYVACNISSEVRLGKLKHAWFSGIKQTYELITENGRSIRATDIHPFLLSDGSWSMLQDLKEGMEVCVNVGKSTKGRSEKYHYRHSLTKYHPYQINNGSCFKVATHRLIIEANMNNMTLESYIDMLRNFPDTCKSFTYLLPTEIVHHKDGNHLNNNLNNLEVLSSAEEHSKEHNWSSNVLDKIGIDVVKSITPFTRESTYDLELETEPHNFIANEFIVHNTGKTTTICWGIGERVPTGVTPSKEQLQIVKFMRSFKWNSCAAMAFNKSIAEVLKKRLDSIPGVTCATSNGFGHRNWTNFTKCKRLNVNASKLFLLLKDKLKEDGVDYKESSKWSNDVIKVVQTIKQQITTLDDYESIAEDADILLSIEHRKYIEWLYEKSLKEHEFIDFDDQLFMPYHYQIPIAKFDLVVVDECVPGWTPVMMGDGSSLPIENIKVGMVVRSYDTNSKIGKDCKVTAVQKLLNQKPLVKIKVQHIHRTGTNKKTNFVICTIDHKIWTTNRGWVPAGEITTSDTVIIETAAQTTQKGKITGEGRKVLSDSKIGNQLGLGNSGGNATHFNSVKGGNGRVLSLAHRVLLEALGNEFVAEYVIKIPSNIIHNGIYANNYKIDIADPIRKIAIEVDGPSHSNPIIKVKDAKKQELLEKMGWKVYRYTNQAAIQNTAEIVCKLNGGVNCPKPANVISVDPVTIRDNYVYDITVEDCHNFYANGILVHNCQDLNKAKQWLAFNMTAKYLVTIGDPNQAIYGFSGADCESMQTMGKYMTERWKEDFQTMSLTITRRCPKTVVSVANKYVPTLRAADEAPEGKVINTKEEEFKEQLLIREHRCMILSRTNAPLMSLAFYLLRNNRPCFIQGKDIGTGIVKLLSGCAGNTLEEKLADLTNVVAKKCTKYEEKGQMDKADLLRDKELCIRTICDNVETIEAFKNKVETLFRDSGSNTEHQLSSVHKSKGLECPWVSIYKPSLLPLKLSSRNGKRIPKGAQQQEFNLAYVAFTRAQDTLEFVIEPKKL